MKRISAVLLAAGESRRMGAVNKLALPVRGEPLLRRTASLLLQLPLRERVLVTGHEAGRTRELVAGLPLIVEHNPAYREGQMTSVHRGLAALQAPCDGVLICLADLPLLTADDLHRLIEGFETCPTPVLVPTFEGQRGNPILIADAQRTQILEGDRTLGCRRLLERHPERVTTLEMDNDHTVFDLDTPEAYARLLARWADEPPAADLQIA
jgi:molybdenum cofactor cytidylyltransferase